MPDLLAELDREADSQRDNRSNRAHAGCCQRYEPEDQRPPQRVADDVPGVAAQADSVKVDGQAERDGGDDEKCVGGTG